MLTFHPPAKVSRDSATRNRVNPVLQEAARTRAKFSRRLPAFLHRAACVGQDTYRPRRDFALIPSRHGGPYWWPFFPGYIAKLKPRFPLAVQLKPRRRRRTRV